MSSIRVLYDGWPLIYQPDGPAALHLSTLLSLVPESVEPVVALPVENSPEGFLSGFELAHNASNRLNQWHQRLLPNLAKDHAASLIHSTAIAASLFGASRTAISPSGYGLLEPALQGLQARIGQAMGRGGLARAEILYPADQPAPKLPGQLRPIPPTTNPAFAASGLDLPGELELPESYLLYHGPSHPATLLHLLESWAWAAASIGELYPLVLLGLSEEAKRFVEGQLPGFHLEDFVQVLPRVHPAHIAPIYQSASALAHPAPPSFWGDPIRHALTCSKPIVAFRNPASEAVVGDAAYLVEEGDLRAFGAALITVVVDDKVSADLRSAAQKRSSHWRPAAFQEALYAIYLGDS